MIKKFSALMLALHALIEGSMGLLMIIAPYKLSPTAGESELGMMTTYGFAAVTMMLIVVWFWPHRRNLAAISVTMGTLATFHTALVAAMTMTMKAGSSAPIILLHATFALSFSLLWIQRKKLTADK